MKKEEIENMKKYRFYQNQKITENYYKLSKFYKNCLEKVFNDFLKIEEEEQFLNGIIPNLKTTNNYFNIYNEIHIERLELCEINFLIEKYNKKMLDEELKHFIIKSYKKVICYTEGDLKKLYYMEKFDGIYRNDTLFFILNYDVFLLNKANFKANFVKVQDISMKVKNNLLKKAKDKNIVIEIIIKYM